MKKTNKIPALWIDTDPGIDDGFCLIAAYEMDQFEVVGISSVNGNVDVQQATKNIFYILEQLDWEIPVYEGEAHPLSEEVLERGVHGNTGLGYLDPDQEGIIADPEEISAIDGIYQTAKELGQMDILAIGPLTNIAMALEKYPDLPEYIGEVIIMGGELGKGNVTAFAEFNFYIDPVAVNRVLEAFDCRVLGLNITETMGFTSKDRQWFDDILGKKGEVLRSFLDYVIEYREIDGEILPVHDLYALYAYAYQTAVIYDEKKVKIIEKGEKRGAVETNEKGYTTLFGIEGNFEHFHRFMKEVFLGK
ncbi:MAG: nucleoside hydrolase [Tissierellia bacterium]|nr:nucleoside hydrolase [Tissierellia bacterium]